MGRKLLCIVCGGPIEDGYEVKFNNDSFHATCFHMNIKTAYSKLTGNTDSAWLFEVPYSKRLEIAKLGAKKLTKFIESKQPKDLVVSCICGDIKLMIDKKELKQFIEEMEI
jgi:hypothetical protein